jgi:purine-cytosine permease-like protein
MLSKYSRWVWVIFVISIALGMIGATSIVFLVDDPQPTLEVVPDPVGCPYQALYLILGATLIVVVIFGAVILRGREKTS